QLCSELLEGAIFTRPRANWTVRVSTAVVIVSLTLSYGWFRSTAPVPDGYLRVAVVQANVLARNQMSTADRVAHIRAYERLTREAASAKPDLIIWPSSSLPAPVGTLFVQYHLARLAYDTKAHLLVGGAGGDKIAPQHSGYRPHANSEFLISPSGQLTGEYHKIALTPFNEYLPLQGKVPWPRWITTLGGNFLPGDAHTLFRVADGRFGVPICGENMYPDLFRRFVKDGANFMVSVTNEGFYGRTSAPYQSLALNVFRAIENRVAVARAATTGVSAFIEPTGRIADRVADVNGNDLFVSGFRIRNVPLSTSRTFYTLYGDMFARGVCVLTLVMVMASLVARRSVRAGSVTGFAPR
ncbi:MAG: apolipoprotein N-acyltransferase, partial [bacterium]